MPDPCLSLHCLTTDNPYPECVSVQVETPSLSDQLSTSDPFPLVLSARFNEQKKSLLNGYLQFGIKGGTLTLKLHNGEILQPQSTLDDWGQLKTQSSTSVVWQLLSPSGVSILKTAFNSSSVASLQGITSPLELTITIAIRPCDLSITSAEGLWRHDIHPNQHGILERVLAHFLYKNRLSSHLYAGKWLINGNQAGIIHEDRSNGEIDSQALAQLHQCLNQLYTANTNRLDELAKLANLDPLRGLAGGNFLAAELSGVELSGASLSQTNFRGANLTDADLSEAILDYSRFSGADLSGAYLGNAQLVGADFYRASLALSNLIGANLTGANLQEANLTQTNLAGATITGAKFGDNPGITAAMAANLRERGAIVQENS